MSEQSPQGEPVIRIVAMPADTNPAGDIFGGGLMSLMDMAAGSAAARRSQGRCATVAVEAMEFLEPVTVGDEVSLCATLAHVGRTSMRVDVEAWRRHRSEAVRVRVTTAQFTFVAIDDQRRPRPVPPEAP
jgi:acyl-CoA thioesterase YciA